MADLKEPSILIVEDELLIAKNLSKKLQKLGYKVVSIVSSGEAAIQYANDTRPDLILMDIVIKGNIDGIEASAQIRDQFNIPVIYTTAYADDDTLERAEATGSYGYVIKPFKERDLHAAIKMALSKHQESLKISQSLAAAEALNLERTKLLSMTSHEFRTPLTTILGSAEMLQYHDHKLTQEKKAKHFERIHHAVNSMNQMLEDVLTLGKAEAGKVAFNPKPLDVIRFCYNLVEELEPALGDKHTVTLKSPKEDLSAELDEKLLYHILINLLTNAIKYSPEAGVITLEITSHQQQIDFCIQDNGIGIPPDYQEKLFQQFERASNVGSISGTGLGLCIVKKAVDLHKGEITFESTLGVGTTFTVSLPSTGVFIK
jgi:signal transduction histidine kinase